MLPPLPEDQEAELPLEEKHCQAPSLAQAGLPPSNPEEPQEPAQEQAQVGISPTGDLSINSDSPPGYLIQSPAIHANLAACMEATPAQQHHGPTALPAQQPGSPVASPDAHTPAEPTVVAAERLSEAAVERPDDICRAGQQINELPDLPPVAEESSAMAFSPGVNALVTQHDL